jgi:hypothetical protein
MEWHILSQSRMLVNFKFAFFLLISSFDYLFSYLFIYFLRFFAHYQKSGDRIRFASPDVAVVSIGSANPFPTPLNTTGT